MLDLESILAEWKVDTQIKKFELDETSRETPALHSKYLEYLSLTKLQLKRAENSQKTLLLKKWRYYNGKMDKDELIATGWDLDPFDGLKVLKGDMDLYYDADPEIQRSEEKIQYYNTIIDTLKEIVQSLNWRHQTVGNMIRYRAFEAGS